MHWQPSAGPTSRPDADILDATGRRLVVGNGFARARPITTGAGALEVKAPRVDDRRDGERFTSAILPRYMRKSPKVSEVLPVLYLRGLSTGDFAPALAEFFGSDAGLSASSITRLTEAWQAEHAEWSERDLSGVDYVYLWVDGIHFNVRLEEDRLCTLVIVGVRPGWTKELAALADGYRESTESWAEVLRGLRDRGLAAPVLATGDGALGFWAALRSVFPETKEQRCWVHATANVLDALPKRLQPEAKGALAKIYGADSRESGAQAVSGFAEEFSSFDKAVAKITGNLETLLCFYDFPAEHWLHLRTTNPIESTFSTVRLRTRVTRGPAHGRPRGDGLQAARRRPGSLAEVSAPELVPLLRAGATFIDGKLHERRESTSIKNPERQSKSGSVAA